MLPSAHFAITGEPGLIYIAFNQSTPERPSALLSDESSQPVAPNFWQMRRSFRPAACQAARLLLSFTVGLFNCERTL